jgi:dihydrofolate reductase
MKFFKQTTMGHAVVMGRKTWLTLKKPLTGRLNLVLSRDSNLEPHESLVVLPDIESVLSMNHSLTTDMFVIGGAQIYREFVPHIDKWIITEVPLTIDDADAFMPEGYLDDFKNAGSEKLDKELTVKFYERLGSH